MGIKDILPWNRNKRDVATRRDTPNPVHALQTDINRAFQDFWRSFEVPMAGGFDNGLDVALPKVDVRDTDRAVEVVAELPGMEEKDVEVSVADGMLSLRGERQSERETEQKGFIRRERSFGRIERVVPLPQGLELDEAKAKFKNGVLTVTIPKTAEAQAAVKRIAVRRA
jgi:HSP20 family protein